MICIKRGGAAQHAAGVSLGRCEEVAQVVEEAAPHLDRLPVAPPQLLVELAVLGGDVSGHHDPDDADLVAATPGAEMGDPLPGDLDDTAGLSAGGQIQGRLAAHRGYRYPVSEHRLGD